MRNSHPLEKDGSARTGSQNRYFRGALKRRDSVRQFKYGRRTRGLIKLSNPRTSVMRFHYVDARRGSDIGFR